MASTEPESGSEVSAAAETSEEAAEALQEPAGDAAEQDPADGAVQGAAEPPVTESGSGAPRRVTSSAVSGVIGAGGTTAVEPATKTPAAKPAGEQPAAAPPATESAADATGTAGTAASQADSGRTATASTAAPRKRPALVAALAGLTRTRTSSATEAAPGSSGTAAAAGDSAGDGPEGNGVNGGGPGAPGKVSRPMVAAAAIGGVVLLSLPFVVASATGGDGPKHNSRNSAAGYTDPGQGADGYVPGADATKGPVVPGGSKRSGSTGGLGAPPITEAASADSVSGPGGKPADGKKDGQRSDSKDTTSEKGSDGKTSGSGSGSSGGSGSGTSAQGSQVSSAMLFSAVGGPHCSSSSVTYEERGAYTDDQEGWTTHDGSYASGGCTGRYRSMPMSGSSSKDSDNSVIWVFHTGKVTSGSCKVSVYIPDDGVVRHVGGQPSYYTVHDGTTGNDTQLGSFRITQVSHRGQWVGASTYKISKGLLTVKLHDRGDDWSSSSRDNAHHAVSSVRVECTA
ncbi:hypothetical protein [Streptomyces sp. NBC_01089]|uniref:hypothetical protein n=1 Tax=Streptomyces sp. NBC_01089 TaxID=2903747 RepID=UPI00386FFED5|nr:hypothetical protein OG510_12925 [Streptomyces sp. NBC_01089]